MRARTHAGAGRASHARARAHTHTHTLNTAERLSSSERSAAETERGRRGGEQQPHRSSSERERQRLEQELGGEITAVAYWRNTSLPNCSSLSAPQLRSCKAKCHRRGKTTAPNMRITWDRIAWKRRLAKDRQVSPFVCLRLVMVTRAITAAQLLARWLNMMCVCVCVFACADMSLCRGFPQIKDLSLLFWPSSKILSDAECFLGGKSWQTFVFSFYKRNLSSQMTVWLCGSALLLANAVNPDLSDNGMWLHLQIPLLNPFASYKS